MNNPMRSLGSRQQLLLFSLVLLISGAARAFSAPDHSQEIRARGVLLWGADAEGGAPYVFPDPQKPEQLTGFEYDLADALAAKLGLKAKMVQNQWDQLIPALDRGNFDILLNGLELTPENQQHIAMSQPYYVYAEQIVVRTNTVGLTNRESLAGKAVGVLSGSVAQRLMEGTPGVDLKIYPGNVQSLQDLKAHRIEAILMDLPIALFYAKPDKEVMFSGEPFAIGYYGVGVRKEDVSLLADLNQAIKELAQERTLERIYRKYGLWDERQECLKDYRPEQVAEVKSVSTLREWPKYLPLLLRGAVT